MDTKAAGLTKDQKIPGDVYYDFLLQNYKLLYHQGSEIRFEQKTKAQYDVSVVTGKTENFVIHKGGDVVVVMRYLDPNVR